MPVICELKKKYSQAGSCMARQLICAHRWIFTEKNANVGPHFAASIILFQTTSAEKLNFSFDTYEICKCDCWCAHVWLRVCTLMSLRVLVCVFLSCNFVNVYLLSIVVIVLTFACTCLHACVYVILNYPGYDSHHEWYSYLDRST